MKSIIKPKIKGTALAVWLCLVSASLSAQYLRILPDRVVGIGFHAERSTYSQYKQGTGNESYGDRLLDDRNIDGESSGKAETTERNLGLHLEMGLSDRFTLALDVKQRTLNRVSNVVFDTTADSTGDDALSNKELEEIASDESSSGLGHARLELIYRMVETHDLWLTGRLAYSHANENLDETPVGHLRYSHLRDRYEGEIQLSLYNFIADLLHGYSFAFNGPVDATGRNESGERISYRLGREFLYKAFFEKPRNDFDFGGSLEMLRRETVRLNGDVLEQPSGQYNLSGYLRFHNFSDFLQTGGIPTEFLVSISQTVYGNNAPNETVFGISFKSYFSL